MVLVEIYTTYKKTGFDYVPGVFVGFDEDSSYILFIDKEYISTLSDRQKKEAHRKALEYKGLEKCRVKSIKCSGLQWEALVNLLSVNKEVISNPDSFDLREYEIIDLDERFGVEPAGFLFCFDQHGAIIFHEPYARSEDNKFFFDSVYSYLSKKYLYVDIQGVENHITDVFREKIEQRYVEDDSGDSEAQRKMMDILTIAVQSKVSDIHFYLLSNAKSYYQFRIYKRLQPRIRIGSEILENVLRSAWRAEGSKVAGIFSTNKSQDRTLQLRIKQGDGVDGIYKFRFQSSPVEGGLKAVMRVIKTDNSDLGMMSFRDFGYEDFQEHQIRMSLNVHDGLVLVCGSTNSGKSTAISKMLIELVSMRPYWAIDSVEDPVENELEGVAQHPVSLSNVDNTNLNEKEARNEAFLRALMDLMRQDPDAINVGEIRDSISAETCRDFVNTGHKLFSTIHAKRVMGAFGRLAEIGMNYDDLCRKGFLTAVIYQTLIPTVCEKCCFNVGFLKKNHPMKFKSLLTILPSGKNLKIHNPKGCSNCRGGIKGLTVCAEILEPDLNFLQLIRDNNFSGAENYWLNELELDNSDFEYKGRSLEDAIIFKVFKGKICPLVAEEYLLPLEYLGRSYSNKNLFPSDRLKSISNE